MPSEAIQEIPKASDYPSPPMSKPVEAGGTDDTIPSEERASELSNGLPTPAETSKGYGSPIVYKIHYKHVVTDELVHSREDSVPIQTWGGSELTKTPILELITEVYTNTKTSEKDGHLAVAPLTVTGRSKTYLKINSPAILQALQTVVDYYPYQDLSGGSVQIDEPFAVLIHFEKELASYREHFCQATVETQELCEREKYAYQDIGVLQDFLKGRVGDAVEQERQRHKNGLASFGMLWLLLKPGTHVYLNAFSNETFIIQSVSGGVVDGRPVPLSIEMWNLDYDGDYIGRRSDRVTQAVFSGDKEISALKVFPVEYWKAGSMEQELQRLEERGKMFFKLTSRRCMSFDGLTSTYPQQKIKGLVMVDSETARMRFDADDRLVVGGLPSGVPSGVHQCSCQVCLKLRGKAYKREKTPFSEYDDIIPEKTKELTPHQYTLCSASVWAYVLKSLEWKQLDVAGFSDPQFDRGMIDTLVMPDERRQMIRALAESYAQKSNVDRDPRYQAWTADSVAGKGEGKIFLLHGPPGVGKTYTAECIAQYTGRPLMSLTVTDIGITPEQVERRLSWFFEHAKLWDAILLIDEADVYMESRERLDLARNSLVSAFLRSMEQCQSLLFLTTNRVGTFDDAFMSRMHVPLYYPELGDIDRKKIWEGKFGKLSKDRGDIMRVPIDTKDYINGKEVKAVKWNGREINNAIQTAVALADFENDRDEEGRIKLKESHLSQIVRMSKEFKTYLEEVHRGDERKRATRQRNRYDEFDPQIGQDDYDKR